MKIPSPLMGEGWGEGENDTEAMTLADTEVKTGRLAYNRTIGYTAMFGRGLYYPVDFAVGDDGRFYVLNRSSDGDKRGVRITIMDLEEGYYGSSANSAKEKASSCGRTPLRSTAHSGCTSATTT